MNFPSLFSPLQIGPYRLEHRVVMAPLTRMRADRATLAPRPLNAEYYGQRATSGGLIIAEASPVMASGYGNPGVPGIYSDAQIRGWREVVEAVHAKGGLIFLHRMKCADGNRLKSNDCLKHIVFDQHQI